MSNWWRTNVENVQEVQEVQNVQDIQDVQDVQNVQEAVQNVEDGLGNKVAEWTRYDSANAAARELQLNNGAISACCNGKVRQTGGYEFRFVQTTTALLENEVWRDVETAVVTE